MNENAVISFAREFQDLLRLRLRQTETVTARFFPSIFLTTLYPRESFLFFPRRCF